MSQQVSARRAPRPKSISWPPVRLARRLLCSHVGRLAAGALLLVVLGFSATLLHVRTIKILAGSATEADRVLLAQLGQMRNQYSGQLVMYQQLLQRALDEEDVDSPGWKPLVEAVTASGAAVSRSIEEMRQFAEQGYGRWAEAEAAFPKILAIGRDHDQINRDLDALIRLCSEGRRDEIAATGPVSLERGRELAQDIHVFEAMVRNTLYRSVDRISFHAGLCLGYWGLLLLATLGVLVYLAGNLKRTGRPLLDGDTYY